MHLLHAPRYFDAADKEVKSFMPLGHSDFFFFCFCGGGGGFGASGTSWGKCFWGFQACCMALGLCGESTKVFGIQGDRRHLPFRHKRRGSRVIFSGSYSCADSAQILVAWALNRPQNPKPQLRRSLAMMQDYQQCHSGLPRVSLGLGLRV